MQKLIANSTLSVSRSGWQGLTRRSAFACMLALSAVLLLAQGIELGHSHEDLQSQLDCQICLKHSSKGKVLAAAGLSLNLRTLSAYGIDIPPVAPVLILPAPKSRAPPTVQHLI